MSELIPYLLKVSLAISLVTIPYYLWLRQDAALNVKRFYLLGGIILSWFAPLMVIRKPAAINTLTRTYLIDPNTTAETVSATLPDTEAGLAISLFSIVLIVYLSGMLILSMRHIFLLLKLRGMERSRDINDNRIVHTNSDQVFTLFTKIFIPRNLLSGNDYTSILIHEKAHQQQLHTIDLIMAEATLLLTWFNPFSWLISRMIKENHEHLADRSVLLKGINPAHYKAQLLNHTMGVELFRLGSQFNHSLTKKRFQMMKKINSPKKGLIKYLALVPAIIIALGLFTAATAQQKPYQGKVVFEDGEPAAGASIVVAGGTIGTVSDLDGTFSLEVEGNPELVISFVGFKNVRIEAGKLAKQNIVLHPKAFEIGFDDIKEGDSNKEKTKIKEENEVPETKSSEGHDEVFYIVEDMPSFPGGKEKLKDYLEKNLVYPEKAKKKGIQGEVFVQFVVNQKGEVTDVEIKRSSDELFNEAAMKVFSDMPLWNPGRQRGKPVKVIVIVPVRFNPMQD